MQLQALPAFEDNYIWLLSDGAGQHVVVDPGDAAPVLAALRATPPSAILLTHHHGDHTGGVAALLERWPHTPVYAPHDARIVHASQRVDDGDTVAIGAWKFQVHSVPGHTRSHIAYHGEGLLLCGDTLFSLGCGRLFEGTPAQMHASLMTLAALPGSLRVCCAHEYTLANAAFALTVDPHNTALQARAREIRALRTSGRPTLPVSLGSERDCNPFLRCSNGSIRAMAARHAGRPVADEVDTFAILRRWKDDFRA